MLITHDVINCLSCDLKIVLEDSDEKLGAVDCPVCGYTNELNDLRIEIREELW